MYTVDLNGKNAVVFGIANHRSIAWAIAQILNNAGARITVAYQNERVRQTVEGLASSLDNPVLVECDVSDDRNVKDLFDNVSNQCKIVDIIVHSIAFANRENLGGRFIDTEKDGFRVALDISAYSLISIARYGTPLMTNGGSVLTMSFQAAERVFPGYNIMSTAKAALENEVKLLASDLGNESIRVNAISAGPLDTLSSRAISGYRDMKQVHADRSPLGRNITVDEVATAALFLCSNLSSGITGEIIHVDTGYHIMGV